MSSFVQVVISQNELKLLDSVEKWITLNWTNITLLFFGEKRDAWGYSAILIQFVF